MTGMIYNICFCICTIESAKLFAGGSFSVFFFSKTTLSVFGLFSPQLINQDRPSWTTPTTIGKINNLSGWEISIHKKFRSYPELPLPTWSKKLISARYKTINKPIWINWGRQPAIGLMLCCLYSANCAAWRAFGFLGYFFWSFFSSGANSFICWADSTDFWVMGIKTSLIMIVNTTIDRPRLLVNCVSQSRESKTIWFNII